MPEDIDNMRKAAVFVLIFLLITSIIAGCSFSTSKEENSVQKGQKTAADQNDGAKTVDGGQKAPGEAAKGQSPAPVKVTADKPDVKRDSGRYVGQIDNNFIEIKISGVPESMAARSFMLGDKVKSDFGKYGLKKDDQIQFSYTNNSNGQRIIVEIKKI